MADAKRQMRVIELQRRIKQAREALDAVDKLLELEQADATLSPDNLADRIREASRNAIARTAR